MPFADTEIPGLYLFEPVVLKDERGYFFESYNEHTFFQQGIIRPFVQDNQSFSRYGVIRGLHYQLEPHAQAKLIRVLQGKILDIALDIRKRSPSFGKFLAVELSSDNRRQFYIPPGFAHGFSVLSETAEVSYKCDTLYNRESEAGIRYDDPSLGIDWRIPSDKTLVSPKDRELPPLATCRNNFEFNR
jgi:dTDP-4-dehydrorhamnose 3,5-epimerase